MARTLPLDQSLILAAEGIACLFGALSTPAQAGTFTRLDRSRDRSQAKVHAACQAGALAVTVLVIDIVMLPSLNNFYYNPAYGRDDYRGIARMLEAGARSDDRFERWLAEHANKANE
jgi:hypothetical protein